MAAHSEQVEESQLTGMKSDEKKTQSVHACNFRAAGRLSNENLRALTTAHESFARNLASAMDSYLGATPKVKFQTLDQISSNEYIASVPEASYIGSFGCDAAQSGVLMEFDIDLVFPTIDLLLGGSVDPVTDVHELSEIEEEIMRDVTSLIARQAESAWGLPSLSLTGNRRVETAVLYQYCPPGERMTVVRFEVEIAGASGSFRLVLPTAFVNALIKQIKAEQPQKKSALRYFPTAGIRERILDCDFVVSADLPSMRVTVQDLIALQPGCVLKLRAPIRNSGMLTVEGKEIFEAAPVRNGAQKAAQLGRKVPLTSWGKE